MFSILIPAAVVVLAILYVSARRRRKLRRAAKQQLRYLSTGRTVQLTPLADGDEFHIFLSHTWLTGQDAVRSAWLLSCRSSAS